MTDFRQAINNNRILVFDGGMGTLLQGMGMPSGISPELFALSRPDALKTVHDAYLQAGSMVITTNTFGGTGFKLGPGVDVEDLNCRMAAVAREAAGDRAWVAGGVGPTGKFVKPLGELTFRELVEAFKAQIKGLAKGGADVIIAETHFDLAEVRAAVVAAHECCDLPVIASMTFDGGSSLTGTPPLTFVDTMQNMGVDMISINCSSGPDEFVPLVREMLPRLRTPLLLYPNAGLPELRDGQTVFPMTPDVFAEKMLTLVEMGAKGVGGCCGTTPEHISALAKAVAPLQARELQPAEPDGLVITSRMQSVTFTPGSPCRCIGERINPTGKKKLTAELQAGQLSEALRLAKEQIEAGAPVLDVNVGAPMVDEPALLPVLVERLVEQFPLPLTLDSANPEAISVALNSYPGSPLVNSISGEKGRMENLGPLCKLYGAPFILLAIEGSKLPVTAAEKITIIERLYEQALAMGIPKRLMIVDILALAVSSKPEAARHCLETIRYCSQTLGLPTVCGLSNISFGLPARELLNSTFLTMGIANGMSGCIANPSSVRVQEALAASEALLGRDPQAASFIAGYSGWNSGGQSGGVATGGNSAKGAQVTDIKSAVIAGEKDRMPELVKEYLAKGVSPFEIVNDFLIPGITQVGEKYEKKEYYLPQLLLSAETMQLAFGMLKPLMEEDAAQVHKPVVIMATVEGDIHDIGKNIVILMMRNHGFEVVDLGKDVAADIIVRTAEEKNAVLIGLSALMTTTMVKMEETIKMVRDRELKTKIMIGGAVVTESYAKSIGADGYAADAVDAVRQAKKLLQN